MNRDRRSFLGCVLGALAVAAGWRRGLAAALDRDIRFGYAAITWGGEDRQAIDDIAAVGFRGIQLRAPAVARWGERPQELNDLLAARGLTLVALSSGLVRLDPAHEAEDLALHTHHARFLKDVGGLYLQILDERPRGRAAVAEDYRRMGALLTELGRRTADLGIPLGYHNHMGNLGQAPDEVARVLDASDPRFVHLELDTAHYAQAGGDPADAVRRHVDRLLFLHVKDVESPAPGGAPESYRFVELGRGTVDFPAFFTALRGARFRGWAVVELDRPVDPARSPKASAELARAYLEQTLGFEV
ncbi:MAG: sugar phosphate isomerase/epimerase family protein [Gemmatimonadales bacterium]